MKGARFHITDRRLGLPSDNLINYRAGPVSLKLNPSEMLLAVTTSFEWEHTVRHAVEAIKEMLAVTDDKISYVSPVEVEIALDQIALQNYVASTIAYLEFKEAPAEPRKH